MAVKQLPAIVDEIIYTKDDDLLFVHDTASSVGKKMKAGQVARKVASTIASAAGQWAMIGTFTPSATNNIEIAKELAITAVGGSDGGSAKVGLFIRQGTAGLSVDPVYTYALVNSRIIINEANSVAFSTDMFKLTAAAATNGTAINLYMKAPIDSIVYTIHDVASNKSGAWTESWAVGATWSASTPTGAVVKDSITTKSNSNEIINGDFSVWQRATSSVGLTGYTSADRVVVSNVNTDISRQSFTPGQTDVPGNPDYFMRITRTVAAGSENGVVTFRLPYPAKYSKCIVTYQFYARISSGTKTFYADLYGIMNGINQINTVGGQIVLTTTWQPFFITEKLGNFDSGATKTINDYFEIRLMEPSPFSTFTIDIAMVKLEKGPLATPFRRLGFEEELQRCLPFCERMPSVIGLTYPAAALTKRTSNTGSTTATTLLSVDFSVKKYKTPTVAARYDINDGADNAASIIIATVGGFTISQVVPAGQWLDLNDYLVTAEL